MNYIIFQRYLNSGSLCCEWDLMVKLSLCRCNPDNTKSSWSRIGPDPMTNTFIRMRDLDMKHRKGHTNKISWVMVILNVNLSNLQSAQIFEYHILVFLWGWFLGSTICRINNSAARWNRSISIIVLEALPDNWSLERNKTPWLCCEQKSIPTACCLSN